MIVVTAPTGIIGHQVLENVLRSGEPVRVIARDPSRIPAHSRERVEVVQGSHGDFDVVSKAFAGADAVFWLVPPDPHAKSVAAAYVDFSRPSKAFLHSWLQSLRVQLAKTSVEVLELVPPYVQTELTGRDQASDPHAMPLSDYVAEVLEMLGAPLPTNGEIVSHRAESPPLGRKERRLPADVRGPEPALNDCSGDAPGIFTGPPGAPASGVHHAARSRGLKHDGAYPNGAWERAPPSNS